MILVAIGTVSYELFIYLYRAMIYSSNLELLLFAKILLIEVAYNTLLTIIIYPLMRRLGYVLEDIFKREQILTRYF